MVYDLDAGHMHMDHHDGSSGSGAGAGAAAALMNPQHGALMLMATSLLGGTSETSERLRLLMTLVLLLPQLKPLIESAVRVVRRVWFMSTRSSDGKYIQPVRKLAAHTCEDGYGRCQSSEWPRRARAVFDRIRDCFEHNDAWCAKNSDGGVAVDQQQMTELEEFVMDDLRIDECCSETLVLLKRGDACPAKIRVGHGIYVRSYKTVERRGQSQSLTMTQLFVEVLVDVRVHPGAARYDAAERFLRDCERALDAKESDELCGPHIFTMIRGDEKPDDDGCRSSDDGDSEDDDETMSSHARRRNRGRGGRGGTRRRGLGFLVKAIDKSNSVPDNPTFPEKDAIVRDVAAFLGNEDQYRRRGIPYNKSFLLRSYPGCGKSRFFTDLAAMFDLVLIHVNPDMVRTEESLRDLWFADYIGGYSVPHKRRLYVIDDPCCTDWAHVIRRKPTTDASAKPTKKTKASSSLFSLGALLNALDGIVKREGHLMFVTTNKSIDFFEPALVRAGRFGSVVNVSRMSAHGIAALFSKWFDRQLPPDVLEVLRDDTLTVADVANDVFSSFDVPTICAQLKRRFAPTAAAAAAGGGGVAAVCDKSIVDIR